MTGKKFKKAVEKIGAKDIQQNQRGERLKADMEECIEHCQKKLFDAVIFNDFEWQNIRKQLNVFLSSNRNNVIQNKIFVAMSFNKEINDYYDAIEMACHSINNRITVIKTR